MRILSQQLTEAFILFLENHDGRGWNKLASDLFAINQRSKDEPGFPYLPNAISVATRFVNYYFLIFVSRTHYHIVPDMRIPLIAYVGCQIATDFLAEFNLGHSY